MKCLIVVDMQNDFVTGSLGTLEAQAIVPKIANLIKDLDEDTKLVFTRDTHNPNSYWNSLEGRKLPVEHCFRGSYGHQIVRDLLGYKDALIFDKNTFGSIELMTEMRHKEYKELNCDEIHIVGVCSDICVISNALALRMAEPNIRIIVHKDLCAGTSVEAHEAAMMVMKSCQCDIVEGVGIND